jgi:hypothetical protein
MRNGLVGLVSATVLAAMAAAVACSSGGGTGGTGGSSSGAAGTAGGASGGSAGGGAGAGGPGGAAGGGGSASAVTTISGSKAVNALTATEVTQLCDDSYAYFGSAIPKATTCKWRGLAYAASSSAPSQTVLQQNCTSKETACQPTDPWANNLGCNDIPATCTATVAQYAACINDEVTAFIQAVTALPSCTSLTSAGTAAIVEAQTANPPASCAALMNTCPELYPPGPFNQ